MPDRYRAPDGWAVDVIHLSSTPDHRDGEWLRVSLHGVHVYYFWASLRAHSADH
jgi:hypothetical protein